MSRFSLELLETGEVAFCVDGKPIPNQLGVTLTSTPREMTKIDVCLYLDDHNILLGNTFHDK